MTMGRTKEEIERRAEVTEKEADEQARIAREAIAKKAAER